MVMLYTYYLATMLYFNDLKNIKPFLELILNIDKEINTMVSRDEKKKKWKM